MTDQRHADHGGSEGDTPSEAERPAVIAKAAPARPRSSPLFIMGLVVVAVAGLVAMRVLPDALPKGQRAAPETPPRAMISIIPLSPDYLHLRTMLRQPLWAPAEPITIGPELTGPKPPPLVRRPSIELVARSLELERVVAGEQPAAIINGHRVLLGQVFLVVRPSDQVPFEFRLAGVEGRSATVVSDEVSPPVDVRLGVPAPPMGREPK